MSDIKIQPSATGSGTVTITAPTTNTARVITLPDSAGTLLDENSSVPSANLTGTVVDARISALTASKLTGDLPAISGVNVTNVHAVNSGRKNILINGAMQVAQRGTTYTISSGTAYRTVDRWKQEWSLNGQMTVEQSTDAPAGFTHSLKSTVVAVSTDNFTSGSEYFMHQQHIEGFTAAALQYGTASAKPLTASFWVKANTPATYSAGFRATMNSAIWANHQAFTINVANTWEKKTLTFNPSTAYQLANVGTSSSSGAFMISLANSANLGQTTNLGSWVAGNLIGLDSTTNMDNLSTKAVGQFVAFTGVQLELGSVATDFEHRSYGEELQLCKRYFYSEGSNDRHSVKQYHPSYKELAISWPVEMRAVPTFSYTYNGGDTTANTLTNKSVHRYVTSGVSDTTAYYIHSYIVDAEL